MPHPYPVSGSPLLPVDYVLGAIGVAILVLASVYVFIHHKHKHFRDRLRSFLSFSAVLMATVIAGGVLISSYVLLPTPKVANVAPVPDSLGVDPNERITIEFTRPVSRSKMTKSISPDIAGVWVFEDPVYATHLYRKLVFYPDMSLNSNTEYQVKIMGIQNTIQTSKSYDFEMSFKTENVPQVAVAISAVQRQTFKLAVPAYLQKYTLSCELASLRMALAYRGIEKSEDELLNQVGVDNTPHVGGVWGNPYEHFVGNVNGNQMRNGYGVYWGPIERVAKMYGNATAFEHGNIGTVTQNILKGNPVIVWVYSKNGTPTSWTTPDGVKVFAAAGEHTVVAVGFVGPADNPTEIIVNDSLVGQVHWSRSLFDRKWATFSQSGVVIFK